MNSHHNSRYDEIIEDLKTLRDELKVRIHLAKAELRDEFEVLEDKWDIAQDKFEALRTETEESARELQRNLNIITDELGHAYKKIRDRLADHD